MSCPPKLTELFMPPQGPGYDFINKRLYHTTKILRSPADTVALVAAGGSKVCDRCTETFAVSPSVTSERQCKPQIHYNLKIA